MRYFSLALSTLGFVAACGQALDPPELGSLEQPIMNGTESDSSDDAAVYVLTHPAVGDAVYCTGTLVAPNLVVTALHCITHSTLGFFTCRPDGSLDTPNRSDGTIGTLLQPGEVDIYVGATIQGAQPRASGAKLLGTGSTQICRGDLGFVILDQPLDAPIAPIRLSSGVKRADLLRVVGYGETEVYGSSGRRARDGVQVIDVGPDSEDQPSITASPRTFVVNEGPCHGDSGGPAFTQDTGALVGVYSLTTEDSCAGAATRNVYSHLSSYSSFVLDAFATANAEPVLDEVEAPTAPPVVAENGCSFGSSPVRGGPRALLGSWALAGLGIALACRRRR